jgi:phospholipase/lecithinase/hemolysin
MLRDFSRARAVAVAVALALVSAGASALTVDQMFVFGDSGSDSGNAAAMTTVAPATSFFPPSQPSGVPNVGIPYDYRFSNGPVTPEYLAGLLGTPPSSPAWPASPSNGNTNFAVGGGMTGAGPVNSTSPAFVPDVPPSVEGLCCNYNFLVNSPTGLQALFPAVQFTGLSNQVALFASRLGVSIPPFDPDKTLFYVQGGYNDVFLALALTSDPNSGFSDAQKAAILEAYTINAALNMGARIGELALLNAKHFFVVNMFDLGRMPFVIEANLQPIATPLTLLFNSVLHSTVDQLRTALGLDILEFDSVAALESIIASGAFTNTTQPCFDANDLNDSLARIAGGCQGYLFFDGAHPTTAAAQISAAVMARQIPEPTAIALVTVALLSLVWMRRQKRA